MPKAPKKPKPVAPVTPTPPVSSSAPTNEIPRPPTSPDGRLQVYEKLTITERSTTSKLGPLTIDEIADVMGWETESEYKKRMVIEENAKSVANGQEPNSKPEHWLYGEEYHCKNVAGEKVRCLHNLGNRPFSANWCEDLVHTHLYGQWAGPFTIPGETVNGETIRISKYGRVISGQHQMTAAKLANEYLLRDRESGMDHPDSPKYPTWRSHGQVFLETIVVTGVSEDPRILMTIDYVKPRTVADMLYTSEVFKTAPYSERKELCRVLAIACDFLWVRTDCQGYKTHPEVIGFLDRHPRLLDCVLHLFETNRAVKSGGRKISNLRLSTGHCASLLYIMGSSGPKTDGDEYRHMDPAPSEKNVKGSNALDWFYWERALDFWTLLAGPDGPHKLDFWPVRKALGKLITSAPDSDTNLGEGGRLKEKLAILAKAWEVWKDHPDTAGVPFTEGDLVPDGCLCLNYVDFDADGVKLPDGSIQLVDLADFLGIDCPQVKSTNSRNTPTESPPSADPTEEEIDKLREEARARRSAK